MAAINPLHPLQANPINHLPQNHNPVSFTREIVYSIIQAVYTLAKRVFKMIANLILDIFQIDRAFLDFSVPPVQVNSLPHVALVNPLPQPVLLQQVSQPKIQKPPRESFHFYPPDDITLLIASFAISDQDYLQDQNRNIFLLSKTFARLEKRYLQLHPRAVSAIILNVRANVNSLPFPSRKELMAIAPSIKELDLTGLKDLATQKPLDEVPSAFSREICYSFRKLEVVNGPYFERDSGKGPDTHIEYDYHNDYNNVERTALSKHLKRKKGDISSFSFDERDFLSNIGPDVTNLDLSNTSLTKAKAREIVFHFPNLKNLNVSASQIDDSCLKEIAKLKHLITLTLRDCPNITAAGTQHLRPLVDLEEIDLTSCEKINDAALSALAAFRKLKKIKIGLCTQITDEGLTTLSKQKEIQALQLIANTKVTQNGFFVLADMPSLKSLYINACPGLTEAAETRLRNLELEKLTIKKKKFQEKT